MAQLRDKVTSEFVFEGTAEECVLVAEKLGEDQVLFDGVGAKFDPTAVLEAHEESMKTRNEREHRRFTEKVAGKFVKEAEERLEEARAQLEG